MKANIFVMSAYGVWIPKIIYGTAWKEDRTEALVEQALMLGFRGIDTAGQPKHYHEPGVGNGVTHCLNAGLDRADLYLQSKFTPTKGQDPARMPYDPRESLPKQVSQSFKTSLTNLQIGYLDSLVLHSPLADERQTMDVWQALEAIYDADGARQLGISNCYKMEQLERLYRNAHIKPAVVQNCFHAETRYDRDIRDFCRQHQILYQSYSTLTANSRILWHATVRGLAAKYECTPEQVFFRYLTQIDIIPLIGTTVETRMRDALAIFDFELTKSECGRLGRLL